MKETYPGGAYPELFGFGYRKPGRCLTGAKEKKREENVKKGEKNY
jgi:hypothetical protein